MYDIRQFKTSLYMLLALGLCAFALAAEEPALWVLAMTGLLGHAWLVWRGRFRPMPRWLSNLITLLAMAFVIVDVHTNPLDAILDIGQFLVFLHLVKLFELRANRDYAQLLILSFLLMVAAAINTASLLFGIMLTIYVFLYLYTCLLFHLKAETDSARAAQTLPEKVHAATLRQDQRYLPRSMRKLTVMVAIAALTMSTAVFVLFPRGAGSGMFGRLQFHQPEALTGFSETPSFQDVARIGQNNNIVARVKVTKNGMPYKGMLMLRGTTFDLYNKEKLWKRTNNAFGIESPVGAHEYHTKSFTGVPVVGEDHWRQVVSLEPLGSRLFALPGVISFRPSRGVSIRFNSEDQSLAMVEAPDATFSYELDSTGVLPPSPYQRPPLSSDIDPAINGLAHSPAILQGLNPARQSDHQRIATNIEAYLHHNFSYTLDLTDAHELHEGDPIAAFLTTVKRGHCEYFAAAMTLMCQSLGIPARYVVGFKCDEYSDIGDYFIVRQSHAHAWVEALTPAGWQTFDPTTDNETPRKPTAWQRTKQFIDYLQYSYANAVIAYDNDHRENFMEMMSARMQNTANRTPLFLQRLRDAYKHLLAWVEQLAASSELPVKILSGAVILIALAIIGALGWFVAERWRIRRRAARIGLQTLPIGDRLRLARQLGFYVELTHLLERQGIVRPAHLTPGEFSDSLIFLPHEAFILVRRLTRIFYRIRYGRIDLRHSQQRRLSRIVDRLGEMLEARTLQI